MSVPTQTPESLQSDSHFAALKSWIINRTGLSYFEDKDADFATAVGRSYHDRPPSALTILKRLGAEVEGELDRIVEELTIGETFFFRHLEMFDAFRDSVFPDLLKRRGSSHFRIWCAGCSVGAEPYSLSILLRDMAEQQGKKPSIEIVGTDLNRRFLRIAETGEYEAWALRGLPEERRKRCFTEKGKKWVLKDKYREGVRFRFHNLVAQIFPAPADDLYAFDLIVCRNVMIYFDTATIRRLADQFHQTLTPGGWLAVGHAEPHTEIFRRFRTVNAKGAVLYQRPSAEVHADPPPERINFPIFPSPSIPAPLAPPPAIPIPPATPLALERSDPTAQDKLHVLAAEGRLVEARAYCAELINQYPLAPEHHYFLGLIDLQLNDHARAAQAMKQCIYLNRDFALAHYFLGIAMQGLEREPARHFRNASQVLAGQPDEAELPFGGGLTVGELRVLVADRPEP